MPSLTPFFLGFLVISLTSFSCDAFTGQGKAKVQDGKCLANDGSLHAVGEEWYDDENCVGFRCYERHNELFYSFSGCGMMGIPDECTLESQPGHYPDCCPIPVCDVSEKKSNKHRRSFDNAFGGMRHRRQLDPATLGAGAFGKAFQKRNRRQLDPVILGAGAFGKVSQKRYRRRWIPEF